MKDDQCEDSVHTTLSREVFTITSSECLNSDALFRVVRGTRKRCGGDACSPLYTVTRTGCGEIDMIGMCGDHTYSVAGGGVRILIRIWQDPVLDNIELNTLLSMSIKYQEPYNITISRWYRSYCLHQAFSPLAPFDAAPQLIGHHRTASIDANRQRKRKIGRMNYRHNLNLEEPSHQSRTIPMNRSGLRESR